MEKQHRPERHHSAETKVSVEKAAAEHLKQLEHASERAPHKKVTVEAAREQLAQIETVHSAAESNPIAELEQPRLMTKSQNYKQTMVSLQHRLKPASRSFSRAIHNPVVESASEAIGKTVARPSVSLGATTCAVLVTGGLYLYARAYGFELRGSEIWISLIVGGAIGLVLEALYRTFRRVRDPIE